MLEPKVEVEVELEVEAAPEVILEPQIKAPAIDNELVFDLEDDTVFEDEFSDEDLGNDISSAIDPEDLF